jgi:hypothetical protein
MLAGPVLVCTGMVGILLVKDSLAKTNPGLASTIAWFGVPALAAVSLGLTQLAYLANLRQMREGVVKTFPIVALTPPKRPNTLVIAHRPTADDPVFRGFWSVEDLFAFVYSSPDQPTFGQLIIQNADGTETVFTYDLMLSSEGNQAQLQTLLPARVD